VALFIDEKGIELPFEPVDLRSGAHKTPEFLAKNPAAQIPVLELDDGTCIAESPAICRYLEELHPEPNLLGRDALERARIEMWSRRVELGVFSAARYYLRHCTEMGKGLEAQQIPAWGELNRGRAVGHMRVLDAALRESRYLAGDRYTNADITLVFVLQGITTLGKIEIPADLEALPRWYEEVSARPSVAQTAPASR
jgi:glutathione S-transferase